MDVVLLSVVAFNNFYAGVISNYFPPLFIHNLITSLGIRGPMTFKKNG